LLLYFLVVAVYYIPSRDSDFIYDDVQVVVVPDTLGGRLQIFAERHWPNRPYYRPVIRLTPLAQKSIHGNVAWPFHLGNALLMGMAGVLACLLLQLPLFGVAQTPSLAAAALFPLYPIASSCVYPISSGRETLLPTVWTLFALYASRRGGLLWRCSHSRVRYSARNSRWLCQCSSCWQMFSASQSPRRAGTRAPGGATDPRC
jgi:hypothetical protein